jgi:hypothetical protein
MKVLSITLTLAGGNVWPWPELRKDQIIHLADDDPPIRVAVLDSGMASGRPSVAIRMDLPDGRVVVARTSARVFCAAGRAIQERYPNLFSG